jgi:hypothetical protein
MPQILPRAPFSADAPNESPAPIDPTPAAPDFDPEPGPAPYPEITPDPSPSEAPSAPATPDDGRPYASSARDGIGGTHTATTG